MKKLTGKEIIYLAKRLAHGELAPDFVDWEKISKESCREVLTLTVYEIQNIQYAERRRLMGKAQRRARKLLRSFLSPQQLSQLKRRRSFIVFGSVGGIYRIHPASGTTERVQRHGKRYFTRTRYCLHDENRVMPPADVSLGHLLLLRCDEPAFLQEANATESSLWDGAWLRRLNADRKERAAAAGLEEAC